MSGGIPTGPVQFLKALLDEDRRVVTEADGTAVSFLDDMARASGFVPLIDLRGGTCRSTPGARERRTLSHAGRCPTQGAVPRRAHGRLSGSRFSCSHALSRRRR